MTSPNGSSPDEDAAFWDARLRSPDCTPGDRTDFQAWREADPGHAQAFDRMQAVLRTLHDAYAAAPELRAFRDEALRARPRGERRVAAAVAVAVLGGAGLTGWLALGQRPGTPMAGTPAPSIYQTAVGERSVVQLSDGSQVTLNTRSRLEVIYSPRRRSVSLVAGQALFHVAKDASRPFVVTAGLRQVTAVGTEFDVRLDPAQVSVTMLEGKVRVDPTRDDTAGAEQQSLVAGQQLTALTATGRTRVTLVDAREATSWSQGRVLFEDTPLEEALAEINRYSSARFVIGDPSLRRIRINGMFRTAQPMGFVRALASYLPIALTSKPDGVTLTARRGAAD